jgi:hypothetical protein
LLAAILNIAIQQSSLLGSVYGKEYFNSVVELVVEPHGEVCPPLIFFN